MGYLLICLVDFDFNLCLFCLFDFGLMILFARFGFVLLVVWLLGFGLGWVVDFYLMCLLVALGVLVLIVGCC